MNRMHNIQPPSNANRDIVQCFLAGLRSTTKNDGKTSRVSLTIGYTTPGLPMSYLNVSLDVDLKTGLSSLANMETSDLSQFITGALPTLTPVPRSQQKSPLRVLSKETSVDDAVDAILGNTYQ